MMGNECNAVESFYSNVEKVVLLTSVVDTVDGG